MGRGFVVKFFKKVALAVSVLSLTGRFYIQTPHRDKQRSQRGHSCFHPYRTRYQSLTIMITLGFLKNCLKIPHHHSYPYHNPKRHNNSEPGVFGFVSECFYTEPGTNTTTQSRHP